MQSTASDKMKSKKNKRRSRGNPMKTKPLTIKKCLEPVKQERSSRRKSTAANTENEAAKKRHLESLAEEDKGESRKNRGTIVPRWLLRIVNNSTEALVLAQLVYWIDRGHKPNPNRNLCLRYVAKKAPQLAAELYRTDDETHKALLRLRKRGFISWENRKFGGERCRHISIDWEKVEAAYRLAIKKVEAVRP